MTDSASVQVDSAATRNDCYQCENYEPPMSKRVAFGGLHCTTCHSSKHGACFECGDCLPAGHRFDRRYCSSSCRAKATKARQLAALEYAVWESENPEAAREEARKREESDAKLQAMIAAFTTGTSDEVKARRRRHWEVRKHAEMCADCEAPLDGIIYRRYNGPREQEPGRVGARVVPVCEDCRCDVHPKYHRLWLCDRCAPTRTTWDWASRTRDHSWGCPDAGDNHAGKYCENCHPLAWREPAPCEGCSRLVANHTAVRPGHRHGAMLDAHDRYTAWVPEGDHWREIPADSIVRVFCSERCRRQVFQAEQKAKRRAARGENGKRCETCSETFTPPRSDARYCSPACRQKAYRDRRAGDAS